MRVLSSTSPAGFAPPPGVGTLLQAAWLPGRRHPRMIVRSMPRRGEIASELGRSIIRWTRAVSDPALIWTSTD